MKITIKIHKLSDFGKNGDVGTHLKEPTLSELYEAMQKTAMDAIGVIHVYSKTPSDSVDQFLLQLMNSYTFFVRRKKGGKQYDLSTEFSNADIN